MSPWLLQDQEVVGRRSEVYIDGRGQRPHGVPKDGYLEIPHEPGWGIEVNEEEKAIQRVAPKIVELISSTVRPP